jgi:beta-lactamase class A
MSDLGAVALLLLCVPFAHAGLRDGVARIAAEAKGRVGVACSMPGASLDCSLNASDQFPMQSVYKLPIAMAVLHQIERGKLRLTQRVRFLPTDLISPGQHSLLRERYPQAGVDVPIGELLRLAVSESDGIASDILLRIVGGPAAVNQDIAGLGTTGIHIRDSEKVIGVDVQAQYRNSADPAALVALLRRLADHPPFKPQHTNLLIKWMTETETGESRIKCLLPEGTLVAHKTGTSGQDNGINNATNDVGLITLPDGRRLAIAVLVADSPESESVRERVIAQIAKLIYDAACH